MNPPARNTCARVACLLASGAWFCCALLAASAHAQQRAGPRASQAPGLPAERVQIRTDTVLRYLPRYELVLDPRPTSSATRYYREIDQFPLYQRVSLDAEHLADNRLEVHIQAHAVTDATLPDDDQLLTGDFALAYVRATPLADTALWGGRRFVTWGLPGGLHLDGVGFEQASELGLFGELGVGRPVTSVGGSLQPRSEFSSPTVAYGGRVGYRGSGRVSASAAYLERVAHGLIADRVVSLSAFARPEERLDLLASGSADVREGLQDARLSATYVLSERFQPEVIYVHADPQKLLPSWSVLSMFASEVYDQAALALITRLGDGIRSRVEIGGRRSYLPGKGHSDERDGAPDASGDDVHTGVSIEGSLHVRPAPYDRELLLEAGHRDEGGKRLLLARVGASFTPWRALRLSPMFGLAFDEERGNRSAWLCRGAADLELSERWQSGLVVDFARTPLSDGELRATLRLSYQPTSGAEGW